jgi:hypothetical protein
METQSVYSSETIERPNFKNSKSKMHPLKTINRNEIICQQFFKKQTEIEKEPNQDAGEQKNEIIMFEKNQIPTKKQIKQGMYSKVQFLLTIFAS